MSPKQKRTFYLYAAGADLDELTLGSIVLNYENPLQSHRYIHPQLSEQQLNIHARTQPLSGCTLDSKTGNTFGVNIEGAQLANLSLNLESTEHIIVASDNGKRIRLKDPEKFFEENVLTQDKAREKLQIWLSAAAYDVKAASGMKPRIWFLTGIYALVDARTFTVGTHKPGVTAGINSSLTAALTSVPIGGSINIGPDKCLTTKMVQSGEYVWAAQYQRLKSKFFWPWEPADRLQTLRLYNTYSTGTCYSSTDPKTYLPPDKATLSLVESNYVDVDIAAGGTKRLVSWTESESESEDDSEDDDSDEEA